MDNSFFKVIQKKAKFNLKINKLRKADDSSSIDIIYDEKINIMVSFTLVFLILYV